MYTFRKGLLLYLAAVLLGAIAAHAQPLQPTEIAINLTDPSKLVILPGGSFLTVQAGPRPNHGTVYFFDQRGNFTWLLLGLPSAAKTLWSTAPAGPDGLAALGNTLFIATAKIVPNGAAPDSSSTQASILRVDFSHNLADGPGPFALQSSDYQILLNGGAITLSQGLDNTATVSLLVNDVNGPTDLTVDAGTRRLYIVSRVDHSISWVPLQ